MLGKEKFSPQGFVFTVKGFWVKSGSGVTAVLLKYHTGLLELEGHTVGQIAKKYKEILNLMRSLIW